MKYNARKSPQKHYHMVFQETFGTLQNFKAYIYFNPAANPKYCKAGHILYAVLA